MKQKYLPLLLLILLLASCGQSNMSKPILPYDPWEDTLTIPVDTASNKK